MRGIAIVQAAAFALLGLVAASGTARAQAWPTKPVTLVAGSAPSSAPDVYARVVAEALARMTGQQVLVENRTGANGNIAAEFVARSPADGHLMWVLAQSQIEINPLVYADMRWKPADFTGVIKGAEAPVVLVVNSSVPVKTMTELAAWVKANPGKVSYASFGAGTSSHFLGYKLNERLGLDMTHVGFRGSGPQVQNLLGGHVPLGFSQIQTGLPHIKSGKFVPLGTTGANRWRQLPDVPTMAELGFPELTATTWFGLLISSQTPPDVLAKVIDAVKRAHDDPGVREKLEGMGMDVTAQAGADFNSSIRTGTERWSALVKATGFRATD